MNVSYLFWISLFVFVFYRLMSSILIYRYSRGDDKLAFLQLFDLSFILTLKINYQFQNTVACSPQRYLTNLEAMYESYAQFIIQSYFLITLYVTEPKNTNIFPNWIVVTSIFISLISIISKKMDTR